ncbi:LLM class flavin-dependent oxidoreductase [Streptomyces sp. NPDC055955]|uniref:LLM class flavin-dependent oxidoreductase n=1 Tax=Streptomyces sp. NPDC055955 TaxID=3345665 RepID=UPI0035DF6DDA
MIGIGIPQTYDGQPTNRHELTAFLASAEAAGYDSAWVADGPLDQAAALDPLSVLAVAAAHTTRLSLGASVLVSTRYEPQMLARCLGSIDWLSEGRVTLGLGLGSDAPADSHGAVSRGRRFEESIAELRQSWSGPAGFPARGPLRVWVGAGVPGALRRAARIADGWISSGRANGSHFTGQLATVRSALREHGRTADNFTIAKRCYIAVDQRPADIEAWFRSTAGTGAPPDDVVITGDAAEVERRLVEMRTFGAQELLLQTVGRDERAQMEALAAHGTVQRLQQTHREAE